MRVAGPEHWERLYRARPATEHSWFEATPRHSLRLIRETGIAPGDPILDIGGGASSLVDHLLDAGYTDLTVLDLAPAALAQSRARLGAAGQRVEWIAADVTAFRPTRRYLVWHDRAVLHFLLDGGQQDRYVRVLRDALGSRGHLILATFGPAGPTRCSGLPVQRHSEASLASLLGAGFELSSSAFHIHETPAGAAQQFLYTRWQAVA